MHETQTKAQTILLNNESNAWIRQVFARNSSSRNIDESSTLNETISDKKKRTIESTLALWTWSGGNAKPVFMSWNNFRKYDERALRNSDGTSTSPSKHAIRTSQSKFSSKRCKKALVPHPSLPCSFACADITANKVRGTHTLTANKPNTKKQSETRKLRNKKQTNRKKNINTNTCNINSHTLRRPLTFCAFVQKSCDFTISRIFSFGVGSLASCCLLQALRMTELLAFLQSHLFHTRS